MTGDETISALEDRYGKLLALVMKIHRLPHVIITLDQIQKIYADPKGINLVVQELEDGLHLRVVGNEEAVKLQNLERKFNPKRLK